METYRTGNIVTPINDGGIKNYFIMAFVNMKRISDIQQKRMREKRDHKEESPTAVKVKMHRTKQEWEALVEEARKKSGIYYGSPDKV